jgi:hypothetical protein
MPWFVKTQTKAKNNKIMKILLIVVFVCSLLNTDGQTEIRYQDFDLFTFKGIGCIKDKNIRPYVITQKTKDGVLLKYCLKNKILFKKYKKINDSVFYEKEISNGDDPTVVSITHRYFMSHTIKEINEAIFGNTLKYTSGINIYTKDEVKGVNYLEELYIIPTYSINIDTITNKHYKSITTYDLDSTHLFVRGIVFAYTLASKHQRENSYSKEEFLRKDFSILPNKGFSFFWHIYLNGRYPKM